jgi:aspartyl-tRNA(Asn)/glutamyl-tRNA(Gln) amidotransferase subunit C
MAVRRDDVLAAARLANLQLEAAELDRLCGEIADIIGHMAMLRTLDLRDVPPFSCTAGEDPPLRGDEPGADPLSMRPGEMAPSWQDGFFTVPRLEPQRDDATDAP